MKRILLITFVSLGLAQTSRAANLVWTPTDANWDILTTANWKDTNTLATVTFNQGDNVLFDDTGAGQPAVALGANLLSPNSVLVDASSQYSFASTTGGKLTGNLSLVKRGSGTLILDADNAISGPTSIEDGVLQIGNGASRGSVGSGPITNSTGMVINRTGTLNLNNYLTGSGGFTNNLNATVNLWGTNTMSGPILIQVGMLSLSNAMSQGSSTDITLDSSTGASANSRLALTGGIDLPAGAAITMKGTAAAGPSRCTLQNTAADIATNYVRGPILIGSGDGLIQLSGLGTTTGLLQVNGNISNHPDNATPFSGSVYLRGAGKGTLNGSVNLPEAKLIRTDAGTFTVGSTGNQFSGMLIAVGTLRLGIDNALPNNVPFSMGQAAGVAAVLDLNGHNQQLSSLVSVASAAAPIVTNSSATDALLTLSDGGDYSGTIADSGSTGKIGLRILNPGAPNAQQLHALCTYSGPTTLELATAISLVGSGDIPNTTPIEMGNGSSIDVSAKADQTFTLGAAQTLKADGMVNIAGHFVSQGTISFKVSKTGGFVSNDSIKLPSGYSNTYGGTLDLELSGESLTSADTLPLFSADSDKYAGAFTTIIPTTPGSGLSWDTSTLNTDGTLRIVSAPIPTTPTNITFAVVSGGSQLEIGWPESYTGWTLQGQTNAITVGISNNWFDVPDSAMTNRVFLPIDPANGSVFYRLRYQP